jgi:hypothetical protein
MWKSMSILSISLGVLLVAFLSTILHIHNWTHFFIRLAFLAGLIYVSSKHLLLGLVAAFFFLMYSKMIDDRVWEQLMLTEGMTNQTEEPKKQTSGGILDLEYLKEMMKPKSSKDYPQMKTGSSDQPPKATEPFSPLIYSRLY